MTSRQKVVSTVPVDRLNLPPPLNRKVQPQQGSLPRLGGVITSDPEDILEIELKREAERQTLFHKVANGILGSPNGYREVEVLIIRWDESIDQFEGHTQEVHT
jgi:hypothetical protein